MKQIPVTMTSTPSFPQIKGCSKLINLFHIISAINSKFNIRGTNIDAD